jgi:hypothetical protein
MNRPVPASEPLALALPPLPNAGSPLVVEVGEEPEEPEEPIGVVVGTLAAPPDPVAGDVPDVGAEGPKEPEEGAPASPEPVASGGATASSLTEQLLDTRTINPLPSKPPEPPA